MIITSPRVNNIPAAAFLAYSQPAGHNQELSGRFYPYKI
jgi:hypothetical protein